ncbi:hypothetical protein C4J96_4124 [Pseudomonas orientalis]|uniref:hypothetical protein n=1 Tax=Pseudomonas orientalis TaxID=76758 RepID=UPI000F57FEA3|nr:hypothetical protein [Pseudomonas orientalis]AZE96213.1 hypothetical protein C4J96_4124 [Pseudomonas orientalis]
MGDVSGIMSGVMGAASAALPGIGALVGEAAKAVAGLLKGGAGGGEESDSGKIAADASPQPTTQINFS